MTNRSRAVPAALPNKRKDVEPMITCFLIPGKPQGKARPRFNTTTKAVHTPRATKQYEDTVRWAYISATDAAERQHSGAVYVEIDAVFPIPKSWNKTMKRKAATGVIYPEVKPDTDNIAKAVLDALNGLAYKDDSQVVALVVYKRYGEIGHVAVKIEDWED